MDCEEIVISDDEVPQCSKDFQPIEEDDEECMIIEETTIVENKNDSKINSTSLSQEFSLTSMVSSIEKRAETAKTLKERMEELDRLMELQAKNHQRPSSSSTSVSDDIEEIKIGKKRKIPSFENEKAKEEKELAKKAREEEKIRKLGEKENKKEERLKKKEEKEKEKERGKIEREMSAAIKSKCELYTYCHVGKFIFDTYPGLEAEIRMLFSDRKIENQLIIDKELGTRIEWRKKCIDMKESDDGSCERIEYSSTENLFAIVVKADILKDVINSNTLSDFIEEQRASFRNGRSTMLIVCYGKLDLMKKKQHQLAIKIFEKYRAQIVQVNDKSELALLTAQYLRSLARREKKRIEMKREDSSSSGGHKVQYLGEKGVTIGTREEMVLDWWNKMLTTIDRLSDAQRRAIIKEIPDPIVGIDKFSKMDYSTAIQELGNILTETGRRIGPAMAHRIYTMLTDESGTAIIE